MNSNDNRLHKPNKLENIELTRGTKALIAQAIDETQSSNRYDLCEWIADNLDSRFEKNCLDYQLKRMNLETTGQILNAIDVYVYKYANKDKEKIEN